MSTGNADVVPTLARMSSTLPWLITLAISAAIVWTMTAYLLGAQSDTLPAESTPITTETFAMSGACDSTSNWQLVYAKTTGRIPATYCPDRR